MFSLNTNRCLLEISRRLVEFDTHQTKGNDLREIHNMSIMYPASKLIIQTRNSGKASKGLA